MAELESEQKANPRAIREGLLLLIILGLAIAYAGFLLTYPAEKAPEPEPVAISQVTVRCGGPEDGAGQAIKATGFIVEQVEGEMQVTTFHHDGPIQTLTGTDMICTVTLENEQ